MISFDSPQVLKVVKVKCLKSILFHTRYFFNRLENKKFVIGDHHEVICNALERVLNGKCRRLIINIAPRYGKTELAVKSLISHGLALNPKAKFIHLGYGDDIALDNSEKIKDLIQSEYYQQLFPDVKINIRAKAKNKWYTTAGGGVLARAAGGQVTGFGAGAVDIETAEAIDENDLDEFTTYEPAQPVDNLDAKFNFQGAIIIDDPIKPEDADMETIREKVNSRFDSTIRNRVNSRNTPIIVIMQRLHPNDLAGYLQRKQEADKWEIISLPCLINDGPDKYKALWPFKHTVEELLALQKNNELVFGRQYQQDPSPKSGLLFPKSELNFYNHAEFEARLHDPDFCFVPCDPANEGGDDFASAPFKLIGDKIYITDLLYNTEGTDYNEVEMVKMIMKHRPGSVGVEGVLGWIDTANRVRDSLDEKNYQGEFRVLRPRTGKHSRILNRASFIKNNFWFRDDYEDFPQYLKFMNCLISYLRIQAPGSNNKHDDAPDLCEMAAAYFERNFKHLWQID